MPALARGVDSDDGCADGLVTGIEVVDAEGLGDAAWIDESGSDDDGVGVAVQERPEQAISTAMATPRTLNARGRSRLPNVSLLKDVSPSPIATRCRPATRSSPHRQGGFLSRLVPTRQQNGALRR